MSRIENLYKIYRIHRRAKQIKKIRAQIPPYLRDNNFENELNFKLWVTEGTRFQASTRCAKLDRLSTTTIGWLSAYLVIISMLNVYHVSFFMQLPENYFGFTVTALSIMTLVFSQFEYARGYSIKAQNYHNCGLEIGELYNQLRILKTFTLTEREKEYKLKEISAKYEALLKKYENHLPVDFEIFKSKKCKYFEMNTLQCWWIKVKEFILVYFKYYLFKYGPLGGFIYLQCYLFQE